MEANEEIRKNKEQLKQLQQLLKLACQERDEARDQLQKLLNKVMPSNTAPELYAALPQLQPDSPPFKPTKANSSITESNSPSHANNYRSHDSSPVDSFFDTVSSPELSNFKADSNPAYGNQPFVQGYNATASTSLVSSTTPKVHQASMVIDNIVKGKCLPQKGKLLQAVLEAGPLLQTLLVAGPLPRWRNPPPLQTFQIPPVSIEGCEAERIAQKPAANPSFLPKSLNSSSFVDMSCGSSQMLSTSSLLNFGSGPSGSCSGGGQVTLGGANANNYVPAGKRQRFQ
ncbi:uncharacterized protein LOC127798228 isoform X2 [Diospyros lotus]|nr:uncharacterized protein LOC127798228 isoform X2 [Diospyros lotus]